MSDKSDRWRRRRKPPGGHDPEREWPGGMPPDFYPPEHWHEHEMLHRGRPRHKKVTLLVVLVIFVFSVLTVSMAVASGFLFLMNYLGFMQPLSSARLPIMLIFLLVVSMLVSVVITSVVGNFSLRPLRKFVDATKEIAAGNFDVRIASRGPEEYKKLVTSFNDMASELGSIETLRNDFVNNISHEYKTPVVSIRGFAKLLKKGNLSKEQQDEYLDIIISESERLTQLSSNVLLLSKLNSTDRLTDLAEFSLDEQLRRTILLLDQQIEGRHIEMDIELESCRITSNEEILQQVWINLLSNAIKFTPENGRISVSLKQDGNRAAVTVSDTGCGMKPETVKHIFDKFYQGEDSRSTQGNGLGLSLVKRITELCGGAVEVKSEEGSGSVFTVFLPVKTGEV